MTAEDVRANLRRCLEEKVAEMSKELDGYSDIPCFTHAEHAAIRSMADMLSRLRKGLDETPDENKERWRKRHLRAIADIHEQYEIDMQGG